MLVVLGLTLVTALAWVYLFIDAARMSSMNPAADIGREIVMPQMGVWGVTELMMLFIMWIVMMVAMMVPSASPMILLFASLQRRRREQRKPFLPTGIFLAGYLVAWTTFSSIASLTQWGLHSSALISPMMISTSPYLGSVLLMSAGVFQWTPWKNTCLYLCRSPISFLSLHWREGKAGAFFMGIHHGAYCVGCCWVLMLLLFVTGVMNLFWVAIIAAFVMLEKVVPSTMARWVTRASGVGFIAWAAVILIAAHT